MVSACAEMVLIFLGVMAVIVYTEQTLDIWTKLTREDDEQVDREVLLSQYVLLCGDSLCNKNDILFQKKVGMLPNISADYQECNCNCGSACFKNGNCCPDMIVSYLKRLCINTKVYPNDGYPDSLHNFFMVSHCPSTVPKTEEMLQCLSPTDFENIFAITNVPVTSQVTHITYKNQYCASCFGEENYVHWDLQVRCRTLDVDFNQMSSFKEILKTIDEYNCSLVYAPGRDTEPYVGLCSTEQYSRPVNEISACNTTGLWGEYDPDIAWACENLDLPYKNHRNIYCYICNPSVASVTNSIIVDKCNVTGEWSEMNLELQRSCELFPAHQRLKPFKNIFCYMCNVNKWSMTRVNKSNFDKGVDFNVKVSLFNHLSLYKYTISTWNIANKLKEHLKMQATILSKYANRTREHHKELKNVLTKYAELCGLNMICNADLLYGEIVESYNISIPVCGVCSCEPNCVYSRSCCVDTLLTKEEFTCISEWHPSSTLNEQDTDASVNALRSCVPTTTPAWLETLCTSEDISDIFSYFPVTFCERKFYKNAYCAICNNEEEFELVTIAISCKTNLEPEQFLTLTSLVEAAKEYSCLIQLQLPFGTNCARTDKRTLVQEQFISSCNVTGAWLVYDDIILHHCEENASLASNLPEISFEGLHFRNIFCFMCNPERSQETRLISECNVTGEWVTFNAQLERECKEKSLHTRWFPYKNWFCRQCNSKQTYFTNTFFVDPSLERCLTHTLAMSRGYNIGHFLPELATSVKQSIFSIKPMQQSFFQKTSINSKKCDNGTLDIVSQTCRDVFCSNGRLLQNKTCRPLLEETENLRYKLSVGFDLVVKSSISVLVPVSYLTEELPLSFISVISESIQNHSNMQAFPPYHVFSSMSCDNNLSTARHHKTVIPVLTLVLNLTVLNTYNRSQLEESLIASRYWIYNITYKNETITFQAKPYAIDAFMPFLVTNASESCYIQATSVVDDLLEPEGLFGVFKTVSKLMACPQIELKPTEYTLDNATGKLYMTKSDIILRTDEVLETEDNNIRICETDYIRYTEMRRNLLTEKYEISTLALVHGLFSYFSSTISLFCLFLTFITYSLFHVLRTLPGKNNMCLVFCLFTAQAILQFGILADDKIVCIAMGVSVHFFWLATFCAMSVCSYHMYRVFCAKSLQVCDSEEEQKTFLTYLAYVTGVPCLIVALTVTVNLGISHGDSWGYGQFLCFLSSTYAVIGAFIVPASVIFSSNIYFFIKVFQTIRNTPSLQSNQNDKRDIIIYLKLCTIIGLFWPLQIVDGIIGTTVLSFFVSALNDFQGVFIFISFSCNKRVVSLYKQLFCRGRRYLQPSTTSEEIPNTKSSSAGSPQHTVQSSL